MRSSLLIVLSVLLFASCKNAAKKERGPSKLYDTKTACLLSQIAYCNDEQEALNRYMPGWQVVWESAELGGNHCVVATDGITYGIAIRGSLIEFSWAAFQNWIYQDLNIVSVRSWGFTSDSSKAKIGEGSWDGWQNLVKMTDKKTGSTLFDFLTKNIQRDTPLLITGHSLGGNLATVYASWLSQQFANSKKPRDSINVITFAAPAAGNELFARDFDKKFSRSMRYENANDIVPKFPCSSRMATLSDLYTKMPLASEITVGYKDMTVSLSRVFSLLNIGLDILEFTNGNASYAQTNGDGTVLNVPLSGENKSNTIESWLHEAGYHHGIARYAISLNVPVVECK
ncbi:MAG TPA: lipase family protein [Chitinophagaceae bacterium]|nr:lipase family protein [Chitinophagaceae bacterium]